MPVSGLTAEPPEGGRPKAKAGERSLWVLLVGFIRIGLFSLGGGTGVTALLEHELVHRWRAMEAREFAEVYALGRTVPGAIGANLACVYGWVLRGLPGALVAVAGICLPSVVLSLPLMVLLLGAGGRIPFLESSLTALRPAVIGIVFAVTVRMARATVSDWWTLALTAGFALCAFGGYLNPVGLVLLAVTAGAGRALWEGRAGRTAR